MCAALTYTFCPSFTLWTLLSRHGDNPEASARLVALREKLIGAEAELARQQVVEGDAEQALEAGHATLEILISEEASLTATIAGLEQRVVWPTAFWKAACEAYKQCHAVAPQLPQQNNSVAGEGIWKPSLSTILESPRDVYAMQLRPLSWLFFVVALRTKVGLQARNG